MKHALILSLLLSPVPALADPLTELEPLLEVFNANHETPGWDVAGIRCAGLLYAQDAWRQDHGGPGPNRKMLEKAATGLDQAVYHRVEEGQDLTKATISVQEDLERVFQLYTDRFKDNARTGHAWQQDGDLTGDANYCKHALS